jgi:acyl carrier protein
MINEEFIEDWLSANLAESLEISADEIDPDRTFKDYNLDSNSAVRLSGELEELLNIRLSPTIVFEYPTISKLSFYLSRELERKNGT